MPSLAQSAAAPTTQVAPAPLPLDPRLTGDEIGYDAWLLPPETPDGAERVIRTVSTASGPLALLGAAGLLLLWLL